MLHRNCCWKKLKETVGSKLVPVAFWSNFAILKSSEKYSSYLDYMEPVLDLPIIAYSS